MKMCGTCGGFMVEGACPNCAAAQPGDGARRWVRVAVCVALAAGGSMTLAACYGGPCDSRSCGIPQDVPNVPPGDAPGDAVSTDAPSRD